MALNLLDELRRARPARDLSLAALRNAAGSLSYRQLFDHVAGLSDRLAAAGLRPGDRALLVAPNSPDFVVALLAILGAGGVATPVSPDAGLHRLERVTALTEARISLVHRSSRLRAALPGVMQFGLSDDLSEIRCEDTTSGGTGPGTGPGTGTGTSRETADSETALILLSSGSTGQPKGVVLRHAGLVWTARTLAERFGLDTSHVELIVCPLTHSGAWQRVAATLFAGGSVVIPEGQVSITALLEDCATFEVGGLYTPPPLVRYLLKSGATRVRGALARLRSIEIGSAPLATEELGRFLDLLPSVRVFVHYGLTECSRAVVLDATENRDRLDTVGRPLPGVDVEIREAGEIWLRGPQASASYWHEPELSARTFQNGWVRTGDHGSLDPDGFLRFLGRADDRITSAGFSFYPGEVEAELGQIEGVQDYLIAGVPDPRGVLGEVPCAFVVPIDPGSWSEVQWAAAARRRLPPHMVPRKVVVVKELPRTSSGKSDRRRMVELHALRQAQGGQAEGGADGKPGE